MPIEAETFFRSMRIRRRELKPGTTFTSVEKERWIPQDPMWKSFMRFVLCTVVGPNTIEVRSSDYDHPFYDLLNRRRPEDMVLEATLQGDQINRKLVRGRFTKTRLSWKP